MSESGVTSEILWHFTGGPIINRNNGERNGPLKTDKEAHDILAKILKSKVLLSSKSPEINKYHFDDRIFTEFDVGKICCVAEIPLEKLKYHSQRWGKFGIGFYRSKLIVKKFRPVHYCLDRNDFIIPNHKKIHHFMGVVHENDSTDNPNYNWPEIFGAFGATSAFVKAFSLDEFDTVYCEREWRKIGPLNFDYKEIGAIIIKKQFFDSTHDLINQLGIKTSLLIWEDVFET